MLGSPLKITMEISMTTEKRVIAIVETQMGVNTRHLDDRLVEDLRGDSLDLVELVMTLEEDFDIEIQDSDAESWKTARDVVKCVFEQVGV